MLTFNRPYLRIFFAALPVAAGGVLFSPTGAHADIVTPNYASSYVLEQAMGTPDDVKLYNGKHDNGFAFNGGFFSGHTSGIGLSAPSYLDTAQTPAQLGFDTHNLELGGDQSVYALLIDGRYDFNYDQVSNNSLHPYLSGGMGMAMYGQNYGVTTSSLQNGQMVPLVRFGGGVAYRMTDQWNLSLDYNAGFSAGGDEVFTGRSQQPVDLQVLNMGMHFSF